MFNCYVNILATFYFIVAFVNFPPIRALSRANKTGCLVFAETEG